MCNDQRNVTSRVLKRLYPDCDYCLMQDFTEIVMEQLPVKLTKFLDTLTGNELNELQKVDMRLIGKIYQAGALFSIEIMNELKKEL